MNWTQHAIMGTLAGFFYLVLGSILDKFVLGSFTIIAFLSFSLPDVDARQVGKGKEEGAKHRHWFWHSAIVPFLSLILGIWARDNLFTCGLFSFIYGMHLLCDVKFGRSGKRGTYLIYKRKGHRMSIENTDRFLLLNFMLCFFFSFLGVVYRNI